MQHDMVNGECSCGVEPLDEDSAALLQALAELDVSRSFDPSKHLRNPKGSPGGGRFRSTVDKLKDAIAAHKPGDGHPFDGFNREQLRRVAKARGIPLGRGESQDSIAAKLLEHLGGAKEAAPAKKVEKKAVKAVAPEAPRSGLDAHIASGVKSSKVLSSSGTGTVKLVTFKDGGKAILKTVHAKGPEGKQQVDAAQLSASLGAAIGIDTPAVHRVNDREFYQDYIDGPTAYHDHRMSDSNVQRIADSGAGRALGLFDLLVDYDDRSNRDNWAFHNNRVVALDHDSAWEAGRDPTKPPQESWARSPFTDYWVDGKRWRPNSLSPASTAAVRERLESLRPEFERLSRGAWLDFALARLAAISAHSTEVAKGAG